MQLRVDSGRKERKASFKKARVLESQNEAATNDLPSLPYPTCNKQQPKPTFGYVLQPIGFGCTEPNQVKAP